MSVLFLPYLPFSLLESKGVTSVIDLYALQGFFIKETILGNADNLRKLYMVNIDPEDWDTSDLLYRMPEHWQAVTVRRVTQGCKCPAVCASLSALLSVLPWQAYKGT